MLKVFFANFFNGTLRRLPFLGYYALAIAIMIAIIFADIYGYSPKIPILNASFGVAAILVHINLVAKRFRDIGLPAMSFSVGMIILPVLSNFLVYPKVSIALVVVFLVCLLLTPSETFGSKSSAG